MPRTAAAYSLPRTSTSCAFMPKANPTLASLSFRKVAVPRYPAKARPSPCRAYRDGDARASGVPLGFRCLAHAGCCPPVAPPFKHPLTTFVSERQLVLPVRSVVSWNGCAVSHFAKKWVLATFFAQRSKANA